MDEETKKRLREIVDVEKLVKPYGWTLRAHFPGIACDDSDGNYFSLDAIAWKAVKKVLEDFNETKYILDGLEK